MNDPTDLPFDRVPLNGAATLPGPKASLDDLLAGSALLPPSRAPVSVTPPAAPKPVPELPKPAPEPAKAESPAPPPEPRWVREAVVTLLTPTRRKTLVLSSAAALAAGALAVNVLFSGKDRTPLTGPTHEEPTVAAANPTPPVPEPARQPDPTRPADIVPTVPAIPVIPVVDTTIASLAPPGGAQIRTSGGEAIAPVIVPVIPPPASSSTGTATNGYGAGATTPGGYGGGTSGGYAGGTTTGGYPIPDVAAPGVPSVHGAVVTPAGWTDPVSVPTPPIGGPPGSNTSGQPAPVTPGPVIPTPVFPPPTGGTSGHLGHSTPASPGGATGSSGGTSGGGTGLPAADLSNLGTGGTGAIHATPPAPVNDNRPGAAPAILRMGSADSPPFTLTKQAEAPAAIRSTEPARTDFDLDLHEPKSGETYATISKLHYGDAKYAEALRAFNKSAELGRVAVEVPPMYVLRKRYAQLIGRPAATDTGRGTEWTPPSK